MDKSVTRRGKPCWYTRPEVGLLAINDACLLKSEIFFLLKNHFKEHPSYTDMREAFEEISFQTEIGQECDGIASMEEDLTKWTWKQYNTITRLKSGHYTFYLSVLLALQYLGLASPNNIKHTKNILIELGTFYQVTNDYLDIFGDQKRTGKLGTDILENKRSWVIIKAFEICNEEQRGYLRENYGKDGTDTVNHVWSIFNSLPLRYLYEQEEDDFKLRLSRIIDEVPESEGLQRDMYWKLLRCIEWCSQKQMA